MQTWDRLTSAEQEGLSVLITDALALAAVGQLAPGMTEVHRTASILEPGDLPVPWQKERMSAQGGALLLSALTHAWDFDDTHDAAIVHCMAVSFPAALYAGLRSGGTGREVLNGVIAGIQAHVRLSAQAGPSHGVIRTAGLGGMAAAIAAATVLGHDHPENAASLALPTAMSPTSRQAVADSSLLKRVQPGLAVQAGLVAAYLSDSGLKGPANWFNGDYGLLPGDEESFTDIVSGEWAGTELSLKPFPSCRYNHEAITASLELVPQITRSQEGSHLDGIERIVVRVPSGVGYGLVARSFANRGELIIDAQFSLPWQVASVFVTGKADVGNLLPEQLHDSRIVELAHRVVVTQDLPASNGMGASEVLVRLTSGEILTAASVDTPTITPQWAVIREKVSACMEQSPVRHRSAEDLYSSVQTVPALSSSGLHSFVKDMSVAECGSSEKEM